MRIPQEKAPGRGWRHVLMACAVALFLILPGCATEIPSGSGDGPGEQVNIAGLRVGDCIQAPASGQRLDAITRSNAVCRTMVRSSSSRSCLTARSQARTPW